MNATGPRTNSLERLVPSELLEADSTGQETLLLHLRRYDFAASFVSGGQVLDCACGVGYGSAHLAVAGKGSPTVLGVDIDGDAIGYAQGHYARERVSFVRCDGAKFDGGPFDTIVSFETIEHVPDPDALVGNLSRQLAPGGTFVASVPITPSVDVNPYHLHDFTRASFLRLFRRHGLAMTDEMIQKQAWSPLTMLKGEEKRLNDMRPNLARYWLTHPRAVIKRGWSTLVDGFCNKYLVCAFRKAD